MSYQDLYVMWHIVNGRPLSLPHLVMKNMLRDTTKVDGALPYGMIITKILTHFEIFIGNELPSKIDVGDIYNASSLKRMGWKRQVNDRTRVCEWIPKEGGRRRRKVEADEIEEQREAQPPRQAPICSRDSLAATVLHSRWRFLWLK
ncbi:hypothetical protein CFOL_v3_05752 [Cephalotus follicularis]|uniref:Uncharacterized protein n=1 Tax=Cephalotus follicularis TaxID=3775 RepID=A0A1Q3B2P9_CEPFO|nr:hypothetical protein CFOL_v3_05752 [Cephalotus follicularis]